LKTRKWSYFVFSGFAFKKNQDKNGWGAVFGLLVLYARNSKKKKKAARAGARAAPLAWPPARWSRNWGPPERGSRGGVPRGGLSAREALFFAQPAGSRAGIFFFPFFLFTLFPLAAETAGIKLYSILYTAFSGLLILYMLFSSKFILGLFFIK
jgi:hypothetical protein